MDSSKRLYIDSHVRLPCCPLSDVIFVTTGDGKKEAERRTSHDSLSLLVLNDNSGDNIFAICRNEAGLRQRYVIRTVPWLCCCTLGSVVWIVPAFAAVSVYKLPTLFIRRRLHQQLVISDKGRGFPKTRVAPSVAVALPFLIFAYDLQLSWVNVFYVFELRIKMDLVSAMFDNSDI
ncbi:hypothetical protein LSH36_355g04006 [Paralvinella palmiformis]|uniref:Transmembrane protein n=1 Tax=Paralvinella palmiformis TaxID=53620 RepID=A0AAD9JFC4_9ANNE|nr:hypothetical protein LSH36_355g04006 [Paralvinella palmiformis]